VRILTIGDEEKQSIQKVIDFAKLHPVSLKQLTEKSIVVGNIAEYVCKIPDGFRIVFSFENQPVGWCRHISISVPDKTKLPSQPAVEMIVSEFGFPERITDQDNVWIETEVVPHAINVIKKLDESETELIKCLDQNEA